MKIACESCGAKYTIADEKVSGRVVKIKCKKCGATIVVNGVSLGGGENGGPRSDRPQADDPTQLYQEAGGADEWTVNVTDDDQRAMSTAEVIAAYTDGTINAETYMWREGMEDWLTLAEVPDLAPMLPDSPFPEGGLPSFAQSPALDAPAPAYAAAAPIAAAAPMAAAPYAAAPMGGAPMGGAFAVAESPRAPAAARRADVKRPKVDLFGAGDAEPAPPASQPPFDKHVGERNENSVLFSLSALAAAEEAAAKASDHEKRAALPMPSGLTQRSSNGRKGMDDLMNLGGGGIMSNPALAPPDLLAPPPPEPPPPPPSMPPPSMGPGSMGGQFGQAMPAMQMPYPYPAQKKPMGLIIGLGAAVAVLAVVVLVLALSGGEETVAQNTATQGDTKSTEPEKKDEPKEEAKADDAKKDDDKDDAKKDDDKDDAPTDEEAKASLGADATPEQIAAFKKAQESKKKDDTTAKKDDDKKKDDKADKDDKKKDDAPASGNKEFSRAEATAALGAAAGSAQGCAKPGGPTGSGKAQVTFAPSGKATSATVGAPFSGTSVGSCVASIFRSASVSPFKGGAVTVSKSFRIK